MTDLTDDEPGCKKHPDAPHGFDRNSSHSEDRYVCECEWWCCGNPAQCWEPCGDLGKSAEHVRVIKQEGSSDE